MALKDGTIRPPETRPAWGHQLKNYATPKGLKHAEAALGTFAPYSSEQLFENPALNLDVRRRAEADIEGAVQGFILKTGLNVLDKGILTQDLLSIARDINNSMAGKYQEYGEFACPFGEAFVLNEIKTRILTYLMAKIALRERTHMSKTHKARGGTVATHQVFFTLIYNPEAIFAGNPHFNEGTISTLQNIRGAYSVLNEVAKPFLQGKKGAFNNPEGKTKDRLKAENDVIGEAILQRRKREVPLCTIEDTDLLEDKKVVFQFSPMAQDLHTFNSTLAEVHLFEEGLGKMVAENGQVQASMQVQKALTNDLSLHIGNLPFFSVDRFKGNLSITGPGKEALKVLAGDSPNYELTRRRILWYLAQLTCHQADVEEIFNVNFTKRSPRAPSDTPRQSPTKPASPGPVSPVVFRSFPTERVARAVESTLGDVKKGKTSLTGHTRLLPLIRKADGEIIACKPSGKAQKFAANHSIGLETGLEILSTGQVIYPEQMAKFLKEWGASSMEEVLELDPGNVALRYETWVEGHAAEDVNGVCQAVQANVRQTI